MSTPTPPADVAALREAREKAILEGHKSGGAERLEDSVFGVLDGVITAVSLSVATAAVVKLDHAGVFLTVVAAAVAGSLSMFTGALLAARAKADLICREREREEHEVEEKPEEERREMEEIYRARGFNDEEIAILLRRLTADKKLWVDTMMRDELGLPPRPEAEPVAHAGTIGVFYLIGGILPALPYLLSSLSVFQDLELSVAIGAAELAAVGLMGSIYSERPWWRGILEIVGVGFGTAAAVLLVTLALTPGF